MTSTPSNRDSLLAMAALIAAMCGSVMLFSDFMQRRGERCEAAVVEEGRRGRA